MAVLRMRCHRRRKEKQQKMVFFHHRKNQNFEFAELEILMSEFEFVRSEFENLKSEFELETTEFQFAEFEVAGFELAWNLSGPERVVGLLCGFGSSGQGWPGPERDLVLKTVLPFTLNRPRSKI